MGALKVTAESLVVARSSFSRIQSNSSGSRPKDLDDRTAIYRVHGTTMRAPNRDVYGLAA